MSDLAPGKPGTQSAKDELLQLLELLRVESGQSNKGAAHHDRIAVEKVEAEAVATLTAERDRARDDYRWMVEHAADQKLEGYRELGARAAAAETRAERTENRVAAQAALTQAAERWADTPADDPNIHEIEAALFDTITKFRGTLVAPEATEEA